MTQPQEVLRNYQQLLSNNNTVQQSSFSSMVLNGTQIQGSNNTSSKITKYTRSKRIKQKTVEKGALVLYQKDQQVWVDDEPIYELANNEVAIQGKIDKAEYGSDVQLEISTITDPFDTNPIRNRKLVHVNTETEFEGIGVALKIVETDGVNLEVVATSEIRDYLSYGIGSKVFVCSTRDALLTDNSTVMYVVYNQPKPASGRQIIRLSPSINGSPVEIDGLPWLRLLNIESPSLGFGFVSLGFGWWENKLSTTAGDLYFDVVNECLGIFTTPESKTYVRLRGDLGANIPLGDTYNVVFIKRYTDSVLPSPIIENKVYSVVAKVFVSVGVSAVGLAETDDEFRNIIVLTGSFYEVDMGCLSFSNRQEVAYWSESFVYDNFRKEYIYDFTVPINTKLWLTPEISIDNSRSSYIITEVDYTYEEGNRTDIRAINFSLEPVYKLLVQGEGLRTQLVTATTYTKVASNFFNLESQEGYYLVDIEYRLYQGLDYFVVGTEHYNYPVDEDLYPGYQTRLFNGVISRMVLNDNLLTLGSTTYLLAPNSVDIVSTVELDLNIDEDQAILDFVVL